MRVVLGGEEGREQGSSCGRSSGLACAGSLLPDRICQAREGSACFRNLVIRFYFSSPARMK